MSRVELLPAQRHALILGALKNVSAASVQDLAERLGASISTVRRDLLYLTEQGYVDRTHGGAVIRRRPMARFEPEATLAAEMAKRQKEEIAALGASRIEANQSVIFDASSTVYAAARRLAEAQITFTAVTNDLRIAALLSGEVDFVQDVPVQDIARLEQTDGVQVVTGPENRNIFFAFDVSS